MGQDRQQPAGYGGQCASPATQPGVQGVHAAGQRALARHDRRGVERTGRSRRHRGRCDIVADIARPYPVPIICALFGVPREDWEQFALWADDIFSAFTFDLDGIDEPRVMHAWGELDAYVDDMVARRRHTLTDDLLSDLIRAEDDGDRLNADELRMLAAGLLLAGTDTTRNQSPHPSTSSAITRTSGRCWETTPSWRRRGRGDHAPLADRVRHAARRCRRDTELAGYLFRPGAFVVVNTFAANRDRAVYNDPDRFDISREGAPAC